MLLFEQALRVDRPPWPLGFATPRSLPATQEQRSKDQQAPLLESVFRIAQCLRANRITPAL
jgi:hypothetical protein